MPNEKNLHEYFRGKSVVVQTPNLVFTPIKDTTGQVSGLEINLSPSPRSGLIGGFLDFSDQDSIIGGLDFSGRSQKESKAQVEQIIENIRHGVFNDRDIRDIISGRGNEAGFMLLLTIVSNPTVRAFANNLVAGLVSSTIVWWFTKPEKPGKSETPPVGTPTDAGSPPENPDGGVPPDEPEKTPLPEESGGALTPGQITRISIRLKDFVPPARDDREPQPVTVTTTDRPVDRNFSPEINWGENDPNLKKYNVNVRIIKNDGFTDPIRH